MSKFPNIRLPKPWNRPILSPKGRGFSRPPADAAAPKSAPGHSRPGERRMTIRNPIEWGGSQIVGTARALSSVGHSLHHVQDTIHSPALTVRHIRVGDIKDAIRQGFEDFEAYRSDVVMLCVVYAVVGLLLTRLVFGNDLIPLVFPLASGFAILGPFAALALYEMSRM